MRSSMLGTEVVEQSHTIRASDSKDTAGLGLSSGESLYYHQFTDLPRGHVASPSQKLRLGFLILNFLYYIQYNDF